jgi:hypothetical protein
MTMRHRMREQKLHLNRLNWLNQWTALKNHDTIHPPLANQTLTSRLDTLASTASHIHLKNSRSSSRTKRRDWTSAKTHSYAKVNSIWRESCNGSRYRGRSPSERRNVRSLLAGSARSLSTGQSNEARLRSYSPNYGGQSPSNAFHRQNGKCS